MFFPLFSAAVVLLVFYIQWLLKRRAKWAPLEKIPGPPRRFLIGNIGWIIKIYRQKSKFHPGVHILEGVLGQNLLYEKKGVQIFWVGPITPVVVCNCPESVELVLTSNTSLQKSYEYRFLHRWLGHGLLTSDGSKWRTRRKLLTPSFHFRILEDFLPTFDEQSLVLVKKLKALVDEEYVNIEPLIVLCTLDIVCETVMGVSIGAQKGDNSEYVAAVHNLGDFFNQRTIRPWLWTDFLFGLTSAGRSFDKDLNTLHSFTDKVIKEKKEILKKGSADKGSSKEKENEFETKKRQALMDLLLDLHINGNRLSEKDIREEVDTFMFEGHDTTAMGVTYALYCIGLYPDIQKKIVEELDGIFGGDLERPTTFDDVRNMKYLECTLKEAQRLFPSVPIIGRTLQEDIHYGDMVIPEGTSVHVNIISMHRRADIYPNPEIFDPDRFLPENVVNRHPYAYIPFSAGPRNCIGQKFALLEEKVIMSNILRHFKVTSLDPRDKVHMKVEFTLKPTQPIRLKFASRK